MTSDWVKFRDVTVQIRMLWASDSFLQIGNPTDFQTYLDSAFVLESPSSLMSQSAISHTKVNKYTLSSYLLMSIQTEHQIGLEFLVRICV